MIHVKVSHVQRFEDFNSRGANFHVLSCLSIYKLLCSFQNCVHLGFFFLVFVLYNWQYSYNASFSHSFGRVCYLPHYLVYLPRFVVLLHCSVFMVFR